MKLSPASKPVRCADIELARSIQADQMRMVNGQVPNAMILATLFAVAMSMFLRDLADPSVVSFWLALKIAVVVPRIAHAKLFTLYGDPHSAAWKNSMRALLFLDGTVWGMAGSWLMPNNDLSAATIVIVGLIGVATTATFTLHADNWATALYVAPVILPTSIQLMLLGDSVSVKEGIGLLVFMASLLVIGQRAHKQIVELLTLRFVTDRMARQAETQNEAKSRFLATMSHELRTPLHGILGLTRIARNHSSEPAVQEKLDLAMRSGEHLLGIVNDILDFSRLEAGRISISEEVFDLTALAKDVAAIAAVTAAGKGLTLETHIELGRNNYVQGDPARVRQVLHNLLGNAVKFTDRGGVKLVIDREPGSQLFVRMRVVDSGIGIAPEDLPRVFDAFHQIDGSFGRRFAGTGLGLTISRQIADAMGGDLTCTSELGHGSEFVLSVPLPQVQPQVEALVHAKTAAASMLAPARLIGHVLLAEDNEVNALVVEASLRELGLTVEHVLDGRSAVKRACEQGMRPDLVLMDCQMPEVDGFEATRLIRNFERLNKLAHLPVVALTANALAGDSEKCLLAGMDAHLSKPFRDDELLAALSRFLPKEEALSVCQEVAVETSGTRAGAAYLGDLASHAPSGAA